MPPAKKSTNKSAVRSRGPRKMSTAHKAALAEGRQVSAVVDRYLSALHVPTQRGCIGRAHRGQHVLIHDRDVRVLTSTGQPVAQHQIDPDRTYQPHA